MPAQQTSSGITSMRLSRSGGRVHLNNTVAAIAAQLHGIKSRLDYYDLMYYVFKEKALDDTIYDQLKMEYHKLLRENPLAASETPKARSIRDQILARGKTAKHDFPMLDVPQARDLHEVVRWLDKVDAKDITIEPYILGCSVELVYVGGTLHKAVNLGDGMEGKDVTINMYGVRGVPQQIPETGRVNIHGRVTMTKENQFKGPMGGAGTRMCVANAMMNLFNGNPEETNLEYLEFIPHSVNIPGVTFDLMELNGILMAWDFDPAVKWVFNGKCREVGAWEESIEAYVEKQLRNMPYETDGFIFTVNETQRRLELGYTSRFPEFAIHYIPRKANDAEERNSWARQ